MPTQGGARAWNIDQVKYPSGARRSRHDDAYVLADTVWIELPVLEVLIQLPRRSTPLLLAVTV